MLREPAVAGQFYGAEPAKLSAELDDLIPVRGSGSRFYGALVPHAGYMYSGKTAGAVYAEIALPPAVILLGPNHTGMGSPGAVWARGAWKTPLGDVGVDSFLAEKLMCTDVSICIGKCCPVGSTAADHCIGEYIEITAMNSDPCVIKQRGIGHCSGVPTP